MTVAAERTVETIIALLSVARSGAAYMPSDISYPAARLEHMLRETKTRVILCHSTQAAAWSAIAASVSSQVEPVDSKPLLQNASSDAAGGADADLPTARVTDRAAVMYTSGSTGTPKGVEILHGALARQQVVMVKNRSMLGKDRVVQETVLTFDVAGNEIWGCLHANATLVMVDDDTRLLGFEGFLLRHKISVISHLVTWVSSTPLPAARRCECL